MLLLFGTGHSTDDLYLDQKITCPVCGKKTTLEAFCEYDAFHVFFLPVYRWNRRYSVRTSCCGASCPLPPRVGEAVDLGRIDRLDVQKLPLAAPGAVRLQVCGRCGFETSQPYRFCPMCGAPLGAERIAKR